MPLGSHSLALLPRSLPLSLSCLRPIILGGGSSSSPPPLRPLTVFTHPPPTAKIALATLLEEKSRAEARACESERRVAEMAAVLHAAQLETDRLKSDLENQRSLVVSDGSEGRAQEDATSTAPAAPDSGAARRLEPPPPLPVSLASMGNCRKSDSTSPPKSSEPIGVAGDVPPDSLSPISAAVSHGREEAESGGPAADGASGMFSRSSPSALRLAEAEARAASAERALLEAQGASKTAMELSTRLGTELERAWATAEAEVEGRRRAQTRIAELERDIHLMGREQEDIRVRAESRLETLKTAFEQEELEAGSKVKKRFAFVRLRPVPRSARSCGAMAV